MAECGNMPDWHPYTQQQTSRTSAPTGAQNASTGHMFMSSMSPPALDGMNLSTESRHQSTKHQNDPSTYVSRNYQHGGPIPPSNCPTSSSLTSGSHMTPLASCISHYTTTSTRNPMMDNLSSSIDPRIGPASGITEEVAHRNSQMPFPGPANHPNASTINVNAGNAIHASTMAAQNSPVGSMSPGRQGPAFGACKGPCCNTDANISYQHWEKYGHYHGATNANGYRDNMRQPGYPMDNRRFMTDINLRKECLDGKDIEVPTATFPVEHRRNYPDYKYRKDNVLPRNYPNNGNNLMQNYPMQNYNFDYQKCPYSVKDYMRRGNSSASSNSKNSSIFKYQEQQTVIAQQKYQHSKQMQYPNGSVMTNGLQNSTATSNMPSPLQNSYYNAAAMPRDLARDYSRDYQQEQGVVVTNRMTQPPNSHVHGSFQKYHQVYHQKMAMQRYSMENHLRAFSRIPGYQSHPKYQECVMRYRELLRLQQSVDYQNVLQEAPKIPSPANPTVVAPINLQFDQNGILINSNFIPPGYSGIHGGINSIASTESQDPSVSSRMDAGANLEGRNQFIDHPEPSVNLTRDMDNHLHRNGVTTMHENPERYFMTGEKSADTERYETERGTANERENSVSVDEQPKEGEHRAGSNETANSDSTAYKNSKDFADKPELDVRQFLANWDESEDEDTAATSMPDVGLSDSNARQFEEPSFSTKSVVHTSQQANNPSDEMIVNENKEDSSVSESAGKQSAENVVGTTITTTEKRVDNAASQREVEPKEMQCIRTEDDIDNIPTIHIVDSLEGGPEMAKIHTVFGSLASTVLNPISIGETSGDTVGQGETIVLFEQDDGVCTKALEFSVSSEGKPSESVDGVISSIIDSSTVEAVTVVDSTKKIAYKSSESVDTPSNDQLVEPTTSLIVSSSTSSATYTTTNSIASSSGSAKSNSDDSTNLPKQNSFTSDESHNPDDISLPDLQTSECTPISTTLNTPIHSDSEESSEHVSDLTISTNPIEIIQNSPIISFTHSPIKIEPYEQIDNASMHRTQRQREHDSLDFDFDREVACRENEKYNETTEASEASVVDDLERGNRNSGDSMLLEDIREPSDNYNEKNCAVNERQDEFYPTTDPLVGMNQISKPKEQTEGVGQTSEHSTDKSPSIEKNDTRGESSVDGILTTDQLENDKCPTILEQEDNFNQSEDLEKLCDMSLDGSCMIPLIPEEEDCDEPRMPVPPMEGNCLTKILNDTMPITNLDVFESSDGEKIDKPDDDMWVEVRYMDKHLEGNSADKTKHEFKKLRKSGKSTKIRQEKTLSTKLKHHSEKIDDTLQEMLTKSNMNSEIEGQERISSPERERLAPQSEAGQLDKSAANSSLEGHKSVIKRSKEECRETSKKSRDSSNRRHSKGGKQPEECSKDMGNEKRLENDIKSTTTKSFLTKHRDANVEIQLANLNLKIHENEIIRNDSIIPKSKNEGSSGDSVDAIEIKINLSRSDLLGNRTKKFFDEDRRATQELLETPDNSSQTRENAVCPSGSKCCRRRRRSMQDGFENTKRTRKNEDERAQHYTAKRIKNRNRHKVRKSMDDELLMNRERSRNENLPEDRIFHLEMAKAFNLPWPRENVPETDDSWSLLTSKDEELNKNSNKSITTKSGNDSRAHKHTKESKTIPSPSYNFSRGNSSSLDFDNFDVAPHSDTDLDIGMSINDSRYRKAKARLEDRDLYRNPTNYSTSFDELASLDAFEINLNTVPIYTTKDGRINYSPNRNYTYRALIMEARQREGYPPLRKLHYPRYLSKNYYRDDNQRKNYKKHYDEERIEKKRQGSDYHLGKLKRTTLTRHHGEEMDPKGSRTKKHDNKRNETRIPSELEYYSNEESRSFCADGLASKTRSSDSVFAAFKPESHKSLPETESVSRRTEILRTDDGAEVSKHASTNYNGPCVIQNVIDTSPKNLSNHELNDSIVTTIFQGQELEISSRKPAEDCQDRLQVGRLNCRRKSRFFQDSELSIKTPMASPLINLEKRPIGWDIELDCQTVLSDSGLESSTTYVEASKECTRKIQRWKSSFVKKAESNRSMYSNRKEYEAIDLSDRKIDDKTVVRYLNDNEPKSLRISREEKLEVLETITHKAVENEDAVKDNPKEIPSISADEKIEKKTEKDKSKATLKPLVKSDNVLGSNRMSEIVKSLDLAIPNRHSGVFEEINSKIEWETKSIVRKDRPTQFFRRDKQVENLMCKVSEALTRRASSDDVDSRKSRNLFFEFPRLPEIETPKYPEVQEDRPPVLIEEEGNRIVEDTEDRTTETPIGIALERSATPETFETSCKDFWNDTSTSFSSCLKLRVPEPVSEMPTESEASQLEDTSTRFASESMDFKEMNETSNFQGNFTFSSQENVNSSVIEDMTGRDFFLSNITENAMTASDDCSRKSSKFSEESSEEKSPRPKESSEKAPILSFSGRIHDSRHDDSPSKSPPCLINENSIPKLVTENNDTPKSSPKHPLDLSRESLHETDKKPAGFDQEISSHPKIPKMIIRNLKSRPGTPTAFDDEAETRNSTKEEQLFEVEIKLGKREENREECKVPKMKIKLEEIQLPRMMPLENPNGLEISPEVTKNFNKAKIRKIRRSSTSRSPIRADKVHLVGKLSRQSSETNMQLDFSDNVDNSNASSSYKFTLIEKSSSKPHNQSSKVERLGDDSKQDRIPKLTIKKQEVTSSGYSSSSLRKKRRSRSPGDSSSRKRKGTSRHSSNNKKEETRSPERRTNSLDNESNTDSQSLSEKVPKVIIKRTSPSAEFKCELSKVGREAITKDSKWQPEVKLQRSWVLDCMAKEPKNGKLALKMLESSLNAKERRERNARKSCDWKRSVSDCDLDKCQPQSLGSIRNNRRRSLDEFLANNQRISHEKDIIPQEENYEIPECVDKSKKLPCSGVRIEDDSTTTNARRSKSETAKSGNSSTGESIKSDETPRSKMNINDGSMNILVSKKPEKNCGNYEEIEGSVIKLDSSDESQTTIEILPASPDNSQTDLDALEKSTDDSGNIHCGTMGKLYSDEAIPTQFELELEIVDNSTVDSLDVPIPEDTSLEDDSTSSAVNLHKLERFKPYRDNTEDESVATDLGCEKFLYSDESVSLSSKNRADSSLDVEANAKLICCSDSLVKEVLAAKETLKRCLTKAKSISRPKFKPRPKTAAEKKQGSGFHFIGLSEFAKTSKCDVKERAVFHNDEESVGKIQATVTLDNNTKIKIKDENASHNSQEKHNKHHKSWNNKKRDNEQPLTSSTSSKLSKHLATTSTNLGGSKTSQKSVNNESYDKNSKTKTVTSSEGVGHAEKISKHRNSVKSTGKINEKPHSTASIVPKLEDSSRKIKSYKIPKISQSTTRIGSDELTNQDKRKTPSPTIMPVLEPQVQLSFELAGVDRDTSRSPPVITKHEENNVLTELPKKIEENVHSDKLDSITKQDSEAVTFADIVSQLAYHEKATIRHRRYCTLCERWFPTAARHRRHLTGYQHRHTELTQRRTVHALFMLFTGKPCPRLLPASIVRTDCLPGEPTPLQIAVQDVAISLEDSARVKPKDVSEKDE